LKKSLESIFLVELAVFSDLGWFDYRCNKPYQHKSMKNQEMILLLLLDSTGIKVANRRVAKCISQMACW
jgi:hypothetical protein